MAGIGFRLNKVLRSEDLFTKLGGIIASVFLACGPWLCTILSIAAISLISSRNLDPHDLEIFRVIVNYTYVGSLILFSIVEMVTTRYIADLLYLNQEKVIPTIYSYLIMGLLTCATIIGAIFYSFTDLDGLTQVIATLLFAAVTVIWSAMIFLSACKDFVRITVAFIVGMFISVAASYLLGTPETWGMQGKLLGFCLGQMFIAVWLSIRVYSEFGTHYLAPRDFLRSVAHNRVYIWIGLFYSLAIWVDKVIFWSTENTREQVAPMLYKSPAYDSGIFIAYMTVIPAMAFFLISIETTFYLNYRRYFSLIDNRAPLRLIETGRKDVIYALRDSIYGLVVLQAFVTLPAVILAESIMEALGFPMLFTIVFRYGLIGTALHVFMLFSNILILYYDRAHIVVKNYFLFFVLNGLFSYITAQLHFRYHGLGYTLATFISLMVSIRYLNRVLKDMHAETFMNQPFGKPTHLPVELEKVSLTT